jgi:LCP family protein required for cell wall assembly
VATVSGTSDDGQTPPDVRYFKMPPKRRRWPWITFYAVWAIIGIVAAAAWGVDRAAQHVLDQISPNNATNIAARKVLVKATGPDTTFIVLGSDHRNWVAGSESLSDSIVLVHMSPKQNLVSIMSVPRDLRVVVPGYAGYQKINAAYALGGPKLSIQTVEQTLGIPVNHYINVGFQGFFQIVQDMGGLYTQVDRRYYNPLGTGYSPIDLQPGYQRLNGNQALAFARFRHTDSDIVRAARQQQIIIDLKRQASENLGFSDIPALLNTVSSSIQTDIHSFSTLINLGQFLLGLPHGRIYHETLQVTFSSGAGPAYDIATPQMIAASVHQFLNPLSVVTHHIKTVTVRPTVAAKSTSTAPTTTTTTSTTPTAPAVKHAVVPASAKALANAIPPGLVLDPGNAAALRGLGYTGLPMLAPALRATNFSLASQVPVRAYRIAGGAHGWPSVVEVFGSNTTSGSDYDIQETRMPDPPAMQAPTSKIYAGKRTYNLYQDGAVLRYVGFFENKTWYWIANTFDGALTPKQMVGIAGSLIPVGHRTVVPAGIGSLTHRL